MGRAPMIEHHLQHGLAITGITGEGAKLIGHLGRCGIGDARHERCDRTAKCPSLGTVITQPRGHQQAAQIGVTQPQRAVLITKAGDLA